MLISVPFYDMSPDTPQDLQEWMIKRREGITEFQTGCYLGTINLAHMFDSKRVKNEYPDFHGMETLSGDDKLHRLVELFDEDKVTSAYGVCDDPQQMLDLYKAVLEDPKRFYIVGFCEMRRDEQPEDGGWRWHKWGPYIGNQTPTCEYLYDEDDIDSVYCFHIIEVTYEFKVGDKVRILKGGLRVLDYDNMIGSNPSVVTEDWVGKEGEITHLGNCMGNLVTLPYGQSEYFMHEDLELIP